MTIKQFILSGLTLLVTFLISVSLLGSWTKPQVQSQLDLYQTNLLLHAAEWQGLAPEDNQQDPARNALIGSEPLQDALEQYQKVRNSAQKALSAASISPEPELDLELGSQPVQRSPRETDSQLVDELDLRLGLLYAQTGQTEQALQTWTNLISQPKAQSSLKQLVQTAQVLLGLWSQPPRLLPEAEQQLQKHLTGWFRYQALAQLYQLQQRQDALALLQAEEQKTAESALLRLSIVGGMPALGGLIGFVLVIFWVGRDVLSLRRGRRASLVSQMGVSTRGSLSEKSSALPTEVIASRPVGGSEALPSSQTSLKPAWSVPWHIETIWQVMVFWFTAFFTVSLILVPLVVKLLGLQPATFGPRTQAYFALFSYGLLMIVGLSILYLCLKPFLEQPQKWLPINWRGNWFWWGIGGYLAALPLVILVSLVNQRLLEDQGGGNPILEIILQSKDNLTIAILLGMVAVLAPFFEETLFRGFFLTSLTRYLPGWGAIALSGLLFAIAHLNLSDILPLTVLGMVLGYVYTRSGNLLSSMLMHSLWNSGSFLGLLILGSSSR